MKKRHPLQENYERFFGKLAENTLSLNKIEDLYYKNPRKIQQNMRTYGYDSADDISKIRNYIDLATLLGIDSRLLKGVSIDEYASYLAGLVRSESEDEDSDLEP